MLQKPLTIRLQQIWDECTHDSTPQNEAQRSQALLPAGSKTQNASSQLVQGGGAAAVYLIQDLGPVEGLIAGSIDGGGGAGSNNATDDSIDDSSDGTNDYYGLTSEEAAELVNLEVPTWYKLKSSIAVGPGPYFGKKATQLTLTAVQSTLGKQRCSIRRSFSKEGFRALLCASLRQTPRSYPPTRLCFNQSTFRCYCDGTTFLYLHPVL